MVNTSVEPINSFLNRLLFATQCGEIAFANLVAEVPDLMRLALHASYTEQHVVDKIAGSIDIIPVSNDPLVAAVQLRHSCLAYMAKGACFDDE